MIGRKASKKVTQRLVKLTQEFHESLFESDYDNVYEELITPEAATLLSTTAWPLVCYEKESLNFLFDSEVNPNPDVPMHHALSLAFQTDAGACRSGLFRGFAESICKHSWHEFDTKNALAFVDGRSAILVADTPTFPLFLLFVEQDNGTYLVDFESLWLFSMQMKASILCEIAANAQNQGCDDFAVEFYTLASDLIKPYMRIKRLMCQNPVFSQYVTNLRKQEIDQQIEFTVRAHEHVQLLTARQENLLPLEQYERILEIVTNMATVMERSPEAFRSLNEEPIRQHFLVQLNGHFSGDATGETFNFSGKTDILIRRNNVNLFVAECKFWRGPKAFKATIDQLLDYATWRDTRLAIFLFNRNQVFSDILSKVPKAVKEHEAFGSQVDYASETGFRFFMRHKKDAERELLMTVLVFDIPG